MFDNIEHMTPQARVMKSTAGLKEDDKVWVIDPRPVSGRFQVLYRHKGNWSWGYKEFSVSERDIAEIQASTRGTGSTSYGPDVITTSDDGGVKRNTECFLVGLHKTASWWDATTYVVAYRHGSEWREASVRGHNLKTLDGLKLPE